MLQTANETIKEIFNSDVVSVNTLFKYSNLTIPPYQRPYKWTIKNVNQLIDDILYHADKKSYRLGTIVIHDDSDQQNIVDGQQRTITLNLLIRALSESEIVSNDKELQDKFKDLMISLIDPKFSSDISVYNIKENYREILRRANEFDTKSIKFLLTGCEFITFKLTDISEAFQFFDSQNARGKDLEPHDLLKAFHLREFIESDDQYKSAVVTTWENSTTEELSNLFGNYLFRIRRWSNNFSARYFSKSDIPVFKGINLNNSTKMPFSQVIRIAHFYLDRYKESYERKIDFGDATYPFQIDQVIINGRRFFELVSYYKHMFDNQIKDDTIAKVQNLDDKAMRITKEINEYGARNRTGDKYVRNLFDCALLYYVDKFGFKGISIAIQKIFIWAYKVRMDQQAVQLATIDNYVTQKMNMFKFINQMTNPDELKYLHLDVISQNLSSKTDQILTIFKELNYYDTNN